MTREEIILRMDLAAKEDRERFFKVADGMMFQPKYKDKLIELEEVKQQWRDMTLIKNWPDIDWPMTLPSWFPKIRFASCWQKGHIDEIIKLQTQSVQSINLYTNN